MRTKVTLVLLFLNVVLFYYISKFEENPTIKPHGNNVFPSEVASIDSFARKDRNGTALLLEKHGETWSLTKPYDWPANPNAIAGIISELQHLNHETSFAVADLAASGQTLADFGLTNPAMTFTFTSGGKSYETKVGDTTKVGNRLYLLSPDGKTIHVVGSSIIDSLGLSLERLRSELIFNIPVFEVRSLSLTTTSKVRLRREGERWTFETPILARANKNAVETTINSLNSLQAQKFLETRQETDPALTGLSTPTLSVTLEGNARREILLLGLPFSGGLSAPRSEGDTAPRPILYYAKIEDKPVVFITAVPPKLLESLQQAQASLRDAHIIEFDPRTVTGITLTAPSQPELNLQRLEPTPGNESWQLVNRSNGGSQAPQTLAADATLVGDLLQKLVSFTAKKFLSDAPSGADLENYGFNRPERKITLNLSTGGGLNLNDPYALTLQIGVKPEERSIAYAKLDNTSFVYEIDSSLLEFTPVEPRHFRQRILRELEQGTRITGLTLAETGATAPLYSRQLHDSETWESILTAEPETRQKTLLALLAQLRSLKAQRFISESFNTDHTEVNSVAQPWKFRLEVTLALTGGNGATQTSSSVLLLTDRINGTTQLAGTTEFGANGVVFALTQEMIDALFQLTYTEKQDPGPPKPAVDPGA